MLTLKDLPQIKGVVEQKLMTNPDHCL